MKKTEKAFFVQNLTEELKSPTAIVLVDYSGMTVKLQQDLKKRLKEVGARMFVAKNTLFKIAAEGAKLPKETTQDTVLSGPIAYVVTEEDPIAPLQVLAKFAEESEMPQLKVGIIEKSFQNKEELERLAKLPGKEMLVSQVLGTASAPLYGLIGTLQGNMQKLIFILEQAKEKQP